MDPRSASRTTPPPPEVSPDGRFYLDGGRWTPLPVRQTDPRAIARGVSNGLGDFVASFILAVVAFPLLLGGAVLLVTSLTPPTLDTAAAIATAVALVGLIAWWSLTRRRA